MDILVGKLKLLRQLVRDWECKKKLIRENDLLEIESSIMELLLSIPTGILSGDHQSQLDSLKKHTEDIHAFEVSTLRHKSRVV